ncbi:uncharacterized protein K02A2.6-like [Panicum virgatum]|uniref:uncharacterized protein K02A2.6-like n=1 Tax=Panicum virgatum TaxID=38727 RepID=UPI0019D63B1E|nr:uncharacterized protein K02A2.6-like [Panicum virgatum]
MEATATVSEVLMIEEDWRIPFIDFIKEFKLPPGVDAKSIQAARIIWRSKGFILEGKDILREIHEGVCGNHTASRTLVGKAYRSGFFWPTAVSDAEDLVKRCPRSPGGFNHILVAVDKFIKWLEYKTIIKISSDRAMDFISYIIHRFGFPHTIITDLGSNFTSQSFWDFCDNACIKVKYAFVAHPRGNGQVERINGLILDGLKKRIYNANSKKGGKWIQELPQKPYFLLI